MSKTLSFKVTVEFDCHSMIDEDSLRDEFNNNPIACYKFITDNFKDSVINFCDEKEKVVKVEVIK